MFVYLCYGRFGTTAHPLTIVTVQTDIPDRVSLYARLCNVTRLFTYVKFPEYIPITKTLYST